MNDTVTPATISGLAVLAAVTFVAGAVNSVAGGGTILTFPVLAAILPPDPGRMVTANATSTIGLWPGAMAAAWAYRGERVGQPPWARWLLLPSVAGAVLGVVLVLVLPSQWFDACVPWLILLAATLFAVQPQVARWLGRKEGAPAAADAAGPTRDRLLMAAGLQFLVAVYGGYFGAGIGILMLAVLGLLGVGDIHRLNGVKNVLASAINGTAAGLFAAGAAGGLHDVAWLHAGIMAVAGTAGGLAGSALARQLPAALVRRSVAVVGFALAAKYFFWP